MTNIQNNVKYATFNLFKLFAEKVQRGTRLVKAKRIPGNIPLVTAGEANRGIAAWIKHNKVLFPANSLTIDMFGNVFYRDQPFFADDNILVLASDGKYSDKVMLYMSAQIRTALQDRFNYGHQFRQKSLRSVIISLPVTPSGTPDFEYMEERIRELEEERIRELEAYLKVTGLSDATLTDEEQAALDKMNMGGVKWRKFRLGDILDFTSIRQAKSQSAIPTDDNKSTRVPYIVQSTKNNMFRRNVNKQYLIDHDEPIIKGNCVALGVTLPAVSYQPGEFGGSQLIVARSKWLNNKTGLFLATAIKKQMYQFSYSHKPGMRIYKALDIELPVTSAGAIDFDFMENYITAIEKQSIRGVIEYKDKVIQTTKNMVNAI